MTLPTMVIITAAEWDGIQHRPHHFTRRAAKTGWQVLYVEPPATLIAPLKDKRMLKRWQNWYQGIRQVADQIYVLAPPPFLPFANKHRWINRLNQKLLAIFIKRALKKLQAEQVDLFTFLPNTVDLVASLSPERLVYDCVDDHGAFTGLINQAVVHEMEQELMTQADCCFATAKQLYEERKTWTKRFYLLPNGAEVEHFDVVHSKLPIPEELKDITCPIAGFYGGISDWIDIDLLKEAALRLPQVSFVMIGPVFTKVEAFKALPNVYFLGPKAYEDLPAYLQCFDVCLVPFRINKLTASVNPVKLHEYLAAGKPVLATPMPEVQAFSEVVEISDGSVGSFVQGLVHMLEPEAQSAEQIENRQEVARQNSWDARWDFAREQIMASKQEDESAYVASPLDQ